MALETMAISLAPAKRTPFYLCTSLQNINIARGFYFVVVVVIVVVGFFFNQAT